MNIENCIQKGHLYDSGHFVDIYVSILNDINGDYAD